MRDSARTWGGLLACLVVMLLAQHGTDGGPAEEARRVKLPPPQTSAGMPLEKALAQRRSVREYGSRALTLQEVSQLLWSAQGVTASWGGRTAPSAGALYPLELYIAAGNVTDLTPGLYHYATKEHALRKVRSEDVRGPLAKAALGQRCVRDAAAVIVIAAEYERTARKYGSRATRYVHIEVGCVCQNIHLACESLNLGTVAVGAFDDGKVGRVLGEAPAPLLLMPVGPKTEAQ